MLHSQTEAKHLFVELTDPVLALASLKRPCELAAMFPPLTQSYFLAFHRQFSYSHSTLLSSLRGHQRAPGKYRDFSSHQRTLFMPHRYSRKTLETSWIVKKVQEKLAATSPQFLAHNQERSAQRGCRGPLSIWGGNVSFTESSIGIRAMPAVVSREGLFPMNLLSHPQAKAYPDKPQATTGINVKN